MRSAFPAVVATVLFASVASAQDGRALYVTHCAMCHETAQEQRIPGREQLRAFTPEQILTALERGVMSRQGSERSRAERRAIALFLTGKAPGTSAAPAAATARCAVSSPRTGPQRASWNGWGVTPGNTRFQTAAAAGLAPADVPRLELAWAFGFPGASSASAQPVVWEGRLFVGSWEGDVYALDPVTGCTWWSIEVDAGVRGAVVVGPTSGGAAAIYFGDLAANVYGVDAATGRQLWKVRVDDHPFARITGSPALHDGRLFVPVSSREESQAADARYECCRFRGSLVALDAASGRQLWKTYTVPDPPVQTGRNAAGTPVWGPSGAAVWVTPTVDVKRRVVYVGTSNAYSAPASVHTDAIVAFDMESGAIRWSRQMTPGDVWNGSCPERAKDHANCADQDSPDFDFAASPILADLAGGRQLLLAAQKSGVVFALDPDRAGREVWQHRVGRGGTSGGIMWGPAVDGQTIYVALSDAARLENSADYDPAAGGGMFALSVGTGQRLWSTPAPPCGDRKPCAPTQAAAVSAMPGIVFSGSNDGRLRAYDTSDGRIVWTFDTVRAFDTVNGVTARGGSINNGGPAVVDGMVFTNAGYSHHSGVIPGNVLLAFRVGGR